MTQYVASNFASCERIVAYPARTDEEVAAAVSGELDDVVPDLLTAKGVNSGYVPLGSVAIRPAAARAFDDGPYPGGLTYSGHPLACAAAVATTRTIEDDRVVEHASPLGIEVFGPGLEELRERRALGRRAQGRRRLLGGRAGRGPRDGRAGGAVRRRESGDECRGRRLQTARHVAVREFHRVHLVPPLTTSASEVRRGIEILDEALTEATHA